MKIVYQLAVLRMKNKFQLVGCVWFLPWLRLQNSKTVGKLRHLGRELPVWRSWKKTETAANQISENGVSTQSRFHSYSPNSSNMIAELASSETMQAVKHGAQMNRTFLLTSEWTQAFKCCTENNGVCSLGGLKLLKRLAEIICLWQYGSRYSCGPYHPKLVH